MSMMQGGIVFSKGEIVLLPFPFSDLSGSKMRPALILSPEQFNYSGQDIICCALTSNKKIKGVQISTKDMHKGRLSFVSVIKYTQLFTIKKELVGRSLGSVRRNKLKQVQVKLQNLLCN